MRVWWTYLTVDPDQCARGGQPSDQTGVREWPAIITISTGGRSGYRMTLLRLRPGRVWNTTAKWSPVRLSRGSRHATAHTCYASVLSTCPFCSLPPDRLSIEAEHALAVPDAFPVTKGHTLVVPRKHVTSIYELKEPEQQGMWKLVAEVRERLLAGLKPDGFNIGFNDGLAGGQTVEHAHVHVILLGPVTFPTPVEEHAG